MDLALWIVAGLLAFVCLVGSSKMFVPKEKMARVGTATRWVEDFSPRALKAIGAIELLAAAGLVLPAVLDIAPVLVPLAATGLVLLLTAGGIPFGEGLRERIATAIKRRLSPRHVPDVIVPIPAVPRTLTGKKLELPVKRILQGSPCHRRQRRRISQPLRDAQLVPGFRGRFGTGQVNAPSSPALGEATAARTRTDAAPSPPRISRSARPVGYPEPPAEIHRARTGATARQQEPGDTRSPRNILKRTHENFTESWN
ncbi:DoxX family protein [Streptomyces sp. NPDC051664]|uniref:DoxX family protein n=1 Tax=Streptomyces sp. NPDC051664 TaxID=3365668 RepID=UPI0037B6A680